MSAATFAAGDPVRVTGKRGYFTLIGWWDDNHRVASVYGGDKDPNGQRQQYAVLATQLRHDSRRSVPSRLAAEHQAKKAAR